MSAIIEKRLVLLREALKTVHANAFYTTLTDAHLSEYIAESDQFLTFLTGITVPDAEFLLKCDPESRHHMLVTLLSDLAKYRLKNVKLLK